MMPASASLAPGVIGAALLLFSPCSAFAECWTSRTGKRICVGPATYSSTGTCPDGKCAGGNTRQGSGSKADGGGGKERYEREPVGRNERVGRDDGTSTEKPARER